MMEISTEDRGKIYLANNSNKLVNLIYKGIAVSSHIHYNYITNLVFTTNFVRKETYG